MSLLAFCHIEKCAGTFLIDGLRQTFGIRHVDAMPVRQSHHIFERSDLRYLKRLNPLVTSVSGHSIRLASDLQQADLDIAYVTLLRSPIDRYMSDFFFFAKHFIADTTDFEAWLNVEERRNFQTKSISNSGKSADAIAALDRFSIVGAIERSPQFKFDMSQLIEDQFGRKMIWPKTAVNVGKKKKAAGKLKESLLAKYGEKILDANCEDIQLYNHVVTQIDNKFANFDSATLCEGRLSRRRSINGHPIQNFLFRNLLYKPLTGRIPFKADGLPMYLQDFKELKKT